MGNRQYYIQAAIDAIMGGVGEVRAMSWLYETAAWGNTQQSPFLNQAIAVQTYLPPLDLLDSLQHIEVQLGRVRQQHWGKRTIDIDILFYDQQVIITPRLLVPHNQLHLRRFVLTPLNDIAPHWQHPILHQSTAELLEACPDDLAVIRL